MTYPRLLLAVLLLLSANLAFSNTLDPVVVTATRGAQTADESLSSVTVITKEEIARKHIRSIQELLHGVAGLNMSNNGGLGKVSSLFLRGTESDHLLVLIDGIKVGSATSGTTAFQDIPIEQIEKIEIVRGPRSSLYGSEAIGGVIQIFTRKGTGAFSPNFSMGIGEGDQNSYRTSSGMSGGTDKSWFNVNLSALSTGGLNACDGAPSPVFKGCFTNEPDDDGYRNLSQTIRAGYIFPGGLEWDIHGLHAAGNNEFDGSFVNQSETRQRTLGSSLRFSPKDSWHLTLSAGQSLDQSDNFKDGVFQNTFNTERQVVSVQNDISIGNTQLITVGTDYQDDKVSGTTAYTVSKRDNLGVFAQYQATFGNHDVQTSLRRDDNEQFGKHVTEGFSWGYAINQNQRVILSYGSAFKAPSFNELYFPNFGNVNLDPETSYSLEIGLSSKFSLGRWSIHAYETNIDDLISFDSVTSAPANLDQSQLRGIEAIITAIFANWQINLDVTLLDPKIKSDESYDGNLLPRRARQSLALNADHFMGSFVFGGTLLTTGKRFNDLANTENLGGYATLNLRIEYKFAEKWRIQGQIENLFDKKYETADLYNQPGRSYYATLRYNL